jgi:aspartyl-tRNA(Asn)/glutamyl-tRNA(Gln) amidotransferase subunit A
MLTDYFRSGLEAAVEWKASRLARAIREREWHRERLDVFFEKYDLLLTPTMAVTAFPIGQFPSEIDGRQVDVGWGYSPFTYPFNVSGQTAANVPCGLSGEGLPIGLHIVGRRGDEVNVIRASAAFEAARPWGDRHPPVS